MASSPRLVDDDDSQIASDRAIGATLASQAYERLRDDIVNARFPPGHKLRTRQLCDRYEVGLAPLREALTRLSGEGLVVQTDRRGFAVPPFGDAHLEELTRTRCWVNEMALRASMQYADKAWEQALVLAHHRLAHLDRYIKTGRDIVANPEWEAAHRDFHTALIAGCRSGWLVDLCKRLFRIADYYRHYSRITISRRKIRENEHEKLFQAVVNGDVEAAIMLLNSHFTETSDLVRERMAQEKAKARAA